MVRLKKRDKGAKESRFTNLTRAQCLAFLAQKGRPRAPDTGRPLERGKGLFLKFQKHCASLKDEKKDIKRAEKKSEVKSEMPITTKKSPHKFEEKKVDYILGPVSLTQHYSKKYNKIVYIFGDHHEDISVCPRAEKMNIAKYFAQIFTGNLDKVIDVFLEIDLQGKLREIRQISVPGQGYLFDDVVSEWKNCLLVHKELCEAKNIRMHYADPRRYEKSIGRLINELIFAIPELISLSLNPLSGYEEKQHFLDIRKRLLQAAGRIRRKYGDFDLKWPLEVTKGAKQFANIEDADARRQIQDQFIDTNMKKNLFSIKEVEDVINELYDGYLYSENFAGDAKAVEQKLRNVLQKSLDYTVPIMDFYLMSRVFRSFERKQGKYSEDPKYVIIYVGDQHARNYRETLDKLGFARGPEAFSNTQCLDITKFHQPFFSSPKLK
jgi:hypothetical protein